MRQLLRHFSVFREEKERTVRDEIVKERERKISNLRESETSADTGDRDRAR